MDKKELVREAIASVKREDVNAVKHNNYPPGIYMEGELPQKKIKNAIDSFASDCMPEDVAALVEEDLLCSGKKGYLFTAEAMYYDRSRLDEKRLPRPLPYDQIMQVELGGSRNTHLVFTLRDGRQVDVYCGVRTNFLRLALKAILCALAGEMEPESDAEVVPEAVSEAETEVVPETVPEEDADAEVILEVMSGEDIEVIPEAVSEAETEVVPEVVSESDAEVILEVMSGEDIDVIPEVMSEAEAEVVPEVVSESDADADVILEVMSGEDIDVIPEVMSGEDADVVPETVPKAKEKDEKCIRAMELFQNGMKAYEADNYTKALSCFKQAAEQGYAEAQFKYGQMYYNGEGVEKDDAEAMSWFQKAAQQECAWAQFFCGIMYAYGKSVPRNGYEAMNWFLKAAEQGLARAQYECGARYYHEGNTDKNRDKAREWLEKAAAQGYEEAIKMLKNKFGQT